MTAGRPPLTALRPAPAPDPPAAGQQLPAGRAPHAVRLLVTAAGVGSAVLVLALLLAGGRPVPSVAGLPDAGPVTGWALPAVRLVSHLAAMTAVGALLLAAFLLPVPTTGPSARATTAVRSAGWASGVWSVTSLLLAVLGASETAGLPLAQLTLSGVAEHAAAGPGRALLAVAVLTAVAVVGCARARTLTAARRLLLVTLLALLPPTVTGHAASAADHELAVSSLVVHVVAAVVWAGGLLAIVLFLRLPSELAPAVRRFSAVALACFVLVAASGLLSAYERLGAAAAAWTSGYGGLVLTKTAALAVLGAMGWQHRRRLVPALAAGRPHAFLSFAGVELSVMGGAFALAVALSRTPTPALSPDASAAAGAVAAHGSGHETLPATVEPVSLAAVLLEWRVNAVVLALAGLLAAGYLTGVRRLRADGTPWPRRRTGAFAAALTLAVAALCSGVATYAAAMLSVQVAQFLLLLVGVPALLVLGAPVRLLERVTAADATLAPGRPRSASPLVRALTDPLTGMALVAGLVFAVYRTGLLDRALGSSGLFLAVNTAALAVGWLLLAPALGSEPSGRPRSPADRAAPLLAAAVSVLLLAAELRFSDQLLAGRWFAALGWSWVDPAADQRRAAVIAAGGAVLLMALAVVAWRAGSPAPRRLAAVPDPPDLPEPPDRTPTGPAGRPADRTPGRPAARPAARTTSPSADRSPGRPADRTAGRRVGPATSRRP